MLKLLTAIVVTALLSSMVYAIDAKQKNEMVDVHNAYRFEVGVSDITWSAKLAAIAQKYANVLKNKLKCKMKHSGAEGMGENLYWASPLIHSKKGSSVQQITSKQVADAWGSEKTDYSYASNTCAKGKVCGHYTQMVWNSTTEVGCASAVCNDKSQVWVCNYHPAGNYIGQKPY